MMFRVANRAAFDRCLARIIPLLGDNCKVRVARAYWKDPGMWESGAVCPAPAGSTAEQVLGCLLAAQRLATGWYVLGSLSSESVDGFSAVFSATDQSGGSSKVPGLEWASFEVLAASQA